MQNPLWVPDISIPDSAPPPSPGTELCHQRLAQRNGTMMCTAAHMSHIQGTPSTVSDEPYDTGRGEAMRHALKPEWIKAENLEMEGLVRRMVWERVSLQSHEKVFFHPFPL